MDRERFEKQLNFILEIDKEKQALRIVYRVAGKGTAEFTAEAIRVYCGK